MGTGMTFVGYGWALLSLVSALMIGTGYYIPVWLVGSLTINKHRLDAYFGCFRRCNYPLIDGQSEKVELGEVCGRYKTFGDIPSFWWQISTVTVGVGAATALLVAFIAIPACCLKDVVSRTNGRVLGITQVLAAVVILVGCVIYPLGWDNKEVREACGRSGAYLLGQCTVGWAFYLVLGGTMLLLICASLSTKAGQPVSWQRLRNSADDNSLLKIDHV